MAHGDYDCCAVCDCRQSYNEQAETKGEICSDCAVDLAERGVFVHDVGELLAWMRKEPAADVVDILNAVEFSQCVFQPNEVDEQYRLLVKSLEPTDKEAQ